MSTTENPMQEIFTKYLQSNIDLVNGLISEARNNLVNDINTALNGITDRLSKLETPPTIKYKTVEGEFDFTGSLDLVATGLTQNKKFGYITYSTGISLNLPDGYMALIVAPIELRTSRSYLVTNYVKDTNNITVTYKSNDRFIPFDIKEVVGKLIVVKNG